MPKVGMTRAYRYFADRYYLDRANRDTYLARQAAGDILLSGNLALAALKTIDGVDISVHAADGDAHALGGNIILLLAHSLSVGQGTWATAVDTASLLNTVTYNGSAADGDNISYSVYLPKGTYTLAMVGYRGTSEGISDVDIDGVEVASFDWYGGGGNNLVQSQTSIVIASSGLKTLRIRVHGKNGSSGGFRIDPSYLVMWRTA